MQFNNDLLKKQTEKIKTIEYDDLAVSKQESNINC